MTLPSFPNPLSLQAISGELGFTTEFTWISVNYVQVSGTLWRSTNTQPLAFSNLTGRAIKFSNDRIYRITNYVTNGRYTTTSETIDFVVEDGSVPSGNAVIGTWISSPKLSDFYAGGSFTPVNTVGFPLGVSTPVPTAGAISVGNFHGVTKTLGADLLVVSGGGGGGGAPPDNVGGGGSGGGGGGFRATTLTLNPTLTYTVVVGAGGTGGSAYNPPNGTSGFISSMVSSLGETYSSTGGSGGGGGYAPNGGYYRGGDGGAPSGNLGGGPRTPGGSNGFGAGGGAGGIDDGPLGGYGYYPEFKGGDGPVWSGNNTRYSGGGGASTDHNNMGYGGLGGGGAAGADGQNGFNGGANTGGGGGGAGQNATGGQGGSGVVIIRYLGPPQAAGGVITQSGGYTYHTFTTSGVLTFDAIDVQYLVVAGGGGGGAYTAGGGGGGGYLSGTTKLGLRVSNPVIVGAGGASTVNGPGSIGGNSSLDVIVATGGGGGGNAGAADFSANNGGNGGSGGGAGGFAFALAGGQGIVGQGYNGGNTLAQPAGALRGAAGGGGAGSVGQDGNAWVNPTGANGANGGVGQTWRNGVYYAGGGAGARFGGGTDGIGGLGGGGDSRGGASESGISGTVNTGGGGGGTGWGNTQGARGGSGIVIVRYPGTPRGGGGVITQVDGFTYHTFTTSGNLFGPSFVVTFGDTTVNRSTSTRPGAAYSWTVPAGLGITSIKVSAAGGGGGAFAYHSGGYCQHAWAGGPGGGVRDLIIPVVAGDIISGVYGNAGGSGGYNYVTGGPGSATTIFKNGSLVCTCGAGGQSTSSTPGTTVIQPGYAGVALTGIRQTDYLNTCDGWYPYENHYDPWSWVLGGSYDQSILGQVAVQAPSALGANFQRAGMPQVCGWVAIEYNVVI